MNNNEVIRFQIFNKEQHEEVCNALNRWLEKASGSKEPVTVFKVNEQQEYPVDITLDTADIFKSDKEVSCEDKSPFSFLTPSVCRAVLEYAIAEYDYLVSFVKNFRERDFLKLCHAMSGFDYDECSRKFKANHKSIGVTVLATSRGYEVSPIIDNVFLSHFKSVKNVSIDYCRDLYSTLKKENG